MQEILDPIDEMLLVQVNQGASTEEMSAATGLKSTAMVQARLARLEGWGYITPPKKTLRGGSAARSRALTDSGWRYLHDRKLVSDRRNPSNQTAAKR